eukprot:TRINITY_DN5266_c0_g1_i1.p1 TRINITY_DN5266_c0_g1~~TRINITY_DN5266_c0_g1_i1.p1  ORF type:complete len:133 (+),score=44.43 TRINITY_DN5266_c0_g1_i1:39-401(+)
MLVTIAAKKVKTNQGRLATPNTKTFNPWMKRMSSSRAPTPLITKQELQGLIQNKDKDPFVLIDVREPKELEYGVIETAKNIPIGDLEPALNTPPEKFSKIFGFPKIKPEEKSHFLLQIGG